MSLVSVESGENNDLHLLGVERSVRSVCGKEKRGVKRNELFFVPWERFGGLVASRMDGLSDRETEGQAALLSS